MTKEGLKKLLVVIVMGVVGLLLLPWFGSIFGFGAILAILPIAAKFPLVFFILSIALFVGLFLANYNKKIRNVVSYYLSGGETDEQHAYAVAEEIIQWLNPLLLIGIFILGAVSLGTLLDWHS